MTPIEYVKRIFEDPEMDDGFAEAVLWGCTGWPSFWVESPPIKCLTRQLRHARRSLKKGFSIDQIFMGEDRCITTRLSGAVESTG